MRKLILAAGLAASTTAYADCTLSLTDDEVKQIIETARPSLPIFMVEWEQVKTTIRRDQKACQYTFIEAAIPATPGKNRMVWIAEDGSIKDHMGGH